MTTKEKVHLGEDVLREFWENMTFAQLVKDVREADEISQSELARRLGVSRQFIQSIEAGKTNVSLEMAKKIAEALQYPLEIFIEVLMNEMVRKVGIKKTIRFEDSPKKSA